MVIPVDMTYVVNVISGLSINLSKCDVIWLLSSTHMILYISHDLVFGIVYVQFIFKRRLLSLFGIFFIANEDT